MDMVMGKLTKRLFLIGAVWLLGSSACASPTIASDTDSKYHLIYLVSAVDLMPGSNVFVDPVFFTDGHDVIGFHEYCKTKDKPLPLERLVVSDRVIQDYCAYQDFSLDPKGYHVLNNYGVAVELKEIRFSSTRSVLDEPVMIGRTTLVSATKANVKQPKLFRNDPAPQYFFLMARDATFLRKIVSVSQAEKPEMERLLDRMKRYAKKARGTVRNGRPYKVLVNEFEPIGRVEISNAIFSDVDLDGKLDLVVGLQATYRPRTDTVEPHMKWLGIAYVLSASANKVGRWPQMDPMGRSKRMSMSGSFYSWYAQNGYPIMTPLVAIRLGDEVRVLRYSPVVDMRHPPGLFLEGAGSFQDQGRWTLRKLKTPS